MDSNILPRGAVLLVEDDQSSLIFLKTILEEAGYRVYIAKDGETALRRVKFQEMDLVLLDIILPGIDGYEVCRRLKRNPSTQNIPIIFLSALTDTFDKVKAFITGGVDYLIKPISLEELLARVEIHLKIARKKRELNYHNKILSDEINYLHEVEESLKWTNQQLTLMNSITRHDILNKISIMRTIIYLAKLEFSDPDIMVFLDKMRRLTDVITSQIQFIKLYQDLGTSEPEWIDIESILTWEALPAVINYQAELHGIEVYADRLLKNAFFNLLDNSIRHGEVVDNIRVFCEYSDVMTIVWEDNGVGIPDDEKENIFERGYGKNTGLGLFFVREILAITGMSVVETGYEGKGARFEIKVPKENYRLRDRIQ